MLVKDDHSAFVNVGKRCSFTLHRSVDLLVDVGTDFSDGLINTCENFVEFWL